MAIKRYDIPEKSNSVIYLFLEKHTPHKTFKITLPKFFAQTKIDISQLDPFTSPPLPQSQEPAQNARFVFFGASAGAGNASDNEDGLAFTVTATASAPSYAHAEATVTITPSAPSAPPYPVSASIVDESTITTTDVLAVAVAVDIENDANDEQTTPLAPFRR